MLLPPVVTDIDDISGCGICWGGTVSTEVAAMLVVISQIGS